MKKDIKEEYERVKKRGYKYILVYGRVFTGIKDGRELDKAITERPFEDAKVIPILENS